MMFNRVIDILHFAKQHEIEIILAAEQLQLKLPKDRNVDKSFIEEIKNNRQAIIDFLKSHQRTFNTAHKIIRFSRKAVAHIPLSFSQERLWIIDRLDGSVHYHVPAVLRLKGNLNQNVLANALLNVVERHEALRTVFYEDNGTAYQKIKEKDGWKLTIVDKPEYQENEAGLVPYIQQLVNEPFDLSKDYMLRAVLIRISEEEYVLVVTMHHIASDAWSLSVIVKEVTEFYSSLNEGREPKTLPLQIQYSDYAVWQREYLKGEIWEEKINYWKSKLQDVIPLQMPEDFKRPLVQSYNGAVKGFTIEKELLTQLQDLCRQQDVTLFMALLAVFKVLLYRYSGQKDICVGSPIANRNQTETESLAGFFVNTLAFRDNIDGDLSFLELLQQVRNTTLEAYSHQEVPFEKVVEAVVKERDVSRSPLFQVMFILQNAPEAKNLHLGDLKLSEVSFERHYSKFDITFSITQTGGILNCSVEYNTDLYCASTIDRIILHFGTLLEAVVYDPTAKAGELKMLTQAEEDQLLTDFNATELAYEKGKNIIHLFQEQARQTPENIAVVFGKEQITYKELDDRSDRLALYLRSLGIKEETLVPICIERGIDMITGIFGILKAGAAYVPVDPDYPVERIGFIIEDTSAAFIACSSICCSVLPALPDVKIINIEKGWNEISKHPATDLFARIEPHHLAYVIYTSGSTGQPKGVMIEHRNVYSFICWCRQEFSGSKFDIVYASTSICFDLSVFEIFYPLSAGKRIRVVENGLQISPLLTEDKMILTNSVPVVIDNLLKDGADLSNLKVINMAGEPVPVQVQQRLDTRRIEVRNLYGPTETTTYSTFYHILNDEPILIGKPIGNTKIYILNEQKQLCPLGVAGEIFIAGDGVTRGYLNRPELTTDRFIRNFFIAQPGAIMYKTGDTGKWLPDGNIEYIGRNDDQVKVRGYRIELKEIELTLQLSEMVKQSIVVVKEDKEGIKRLVGYIVPEGRLEKDKLNNYLQEKLPGYMIPAIWVELQNFPLTSNGKIDRKALPEVELNDFISKSYISPRNETEYKLVKVWQELLNIDQVGIKDNFFELGGDSITSIQLVSRLRRLNVHLHPKDVFLYQTVEKLAGAVKGLQTSGVIAEQGFLQGLSGLLPIQEWFLNSHPKNVNHFNQSVLLKINKALAADKLQHAVDQLTEYHDALRFRYYQNNGQWQQEYGTYKTSLVIENLEYLSEENLDALIAGKANYYQKTVNIGNGDLIRVVLIKTPTSEIYNRLLIIIHHLAIDGVSWRILLEDLDLTLNNLDNNKSNVNKGSSYRQWYEVLKSYSQSKSLLAQTDYWQQAYHNYLPLSLDTTYDQKLRVKDLKNYVSVLNENLTRQLLQEVPKVYHTEINDILLYALANTFCQWSDSNKIVIGLEGHGREAIEKDVDISHTLGWFTSLYPVLLNLAIEDSIADGIKTVKEQLRLVPDKGLGFGLLKYVNKEKSLQGGDCWDIIFNYLGQSDNVIKESSWLKGSGENAGDTRCEDLIINEKFSVTCIIRSGKLFVNWSYSNLHYKDETVKNLAESFSTKLQEAIVHCSEQETSFYTPADFNLQNFLTYRELDTFLDEQIEKDRVRRDYLQSISKLSSLQQGMLFHSLYDDSSGAYIHQVGCNCINLDIDVFKESWQRILSSHSILRSAFYYDVFSIQVQCVYDDVMFPLDIFDYSSLTNTERSAAIEEYVHADRKNSFYFKEAPLMRIALFKLDRSSYRMIWTYHHLLLDGWSMPLLFREFLNNYELILSGSKLPSIEEDRYEDYIRYIESRSTEREEEYWSSYFKSLEQNKLLPFIKSTADRNKGVGHFRSVYSNISTAITSDIENFSRKNHITVSTLMQGVWAFILSNYTGSNEVIFGVTVSGRPEELSKVEERVGMYINTLPLYNILSPEQKIIDWLQAIQEQQVSSRQFQYTSLSDIKRWTGYQGDMFDTTLTFQNFPIGKVLSYRNWSLKVENVIIQEQNNYPLSITVSSTEEINIRFSYNSDLLDEVYIKNIQDHFLHVLQQIVQKNDGFVKDINIITSREEQQLLLKFNNLTPFDQDTTVIQLFKQQVDFAPENIAIVFGDQKLTYRQLDQKSTQFAAYLQLNGVKTKSLVPICLRAGSKMIVAILGVLKAGAAYVPIDPDYPLERISGVLQQIKAEVLITKKQFFPAFPDNVRMVDADVDLNKTELPFPFQQVLISANDLAYVIFTSGSTGEPKGVMIEHSSLVNYITNKETSYLNTGQDSFGTFLHLPFTFDASVTGIFMPLVYGKAIVVSSKQSYEVFEDPNFWKYAPYDFIKITPAHISLLQNVIENDCRQLSTKRLVIGGEALLPAHFNYFTDNDIDVEIINEYGPTEATVGCSTFSFQTAGIAQLKNDILIGKPIDHVLMYILNKEGGLVPVGAPGEIYIGGAGLARGYFNSPLLTRERFIKNPFVSTPDSYLYKSGDWGSWLPDGNIKYLGRIDDQVKIRGYRIELSEVQSAILKTGLVSEAAVLAKEDKEGAKRLAAYVVANESFDKEKLVSVLSAVLPNYMVPTIWSRLDRLPLTSNGKIDKRALLDLENNNETAAHTSPTNETEERLTEIWKELLELEKIGIHDDFFKIGGDSLLAVRMASYIERNLQISVSVQVIFQFTTISGLGKYLSLQGNNNSPEKNTFLFELLDV